MAKILVPARDQLAWLRQVARDKALPHVAVRVAITIDACRNNDTGKMTIGYDRISQNSSIGRMTAFRAVQSLIDRGHLVAGGGGGRQRANEYRTVLQTVPRAIPFEVGNGTTGDTVSGSETVPNQNVNSITGDTHSLKNLPSEGISSHVRAREERAHGASKRAFEGSDPAGVWVKPGTPEFDAWIEAFTELGAKAAGEMRRCELEGRAFRVVSQWPPRRRSRSPLTNAIDQVIDHLAAEQRRQS